MLSTRGRQERRRVPGRRFPVRRRAGRQNRRSRRRGFRNRPGPTASTMRRSSTRRGEPRRSAGRRKTCEGSRPTISMIAWSGVVSATTRSPATRPSRKHHHAVGDLEHFVQPVRHIDHADAARPQPAQGIEQPRHLIGRAGWRWAHRAPGSRPRRRAPSRSRRATSRCG